MRLISKSHSVNALCLIAESHPGHIPGLDRVSRGDEALFIERLGFCRVIFELILSRPLSCWKFLVIIFSAIMDAEAFDCDIELNVILLFLSPLVSAEYRIAILLVPIKQLALRMKKTSLC